MKKIFFMFIIILFFLLLFLSCNMGIESGSDIKAGWSHTNILGIRHNYEFYEDGTGLEMWSGTFASNTVYYLKYDFNNKDHTYNRILLKKYKSLDDLNNDVTDDIEEELDYYFNLTKDVLYLNKTSEGIFLGFEKFNYKYRDRYF